MTRLPTSCRRSYNLHASETRPNDGETQNTKQIIQYCSVSYNAFISTKKFSLRKEIYPLHSTAEVIGLNVWLRWWKQDSQIICIYSLVRVKTWNMLLPVLAFIKPLKKLVSWQELKVKAAVGKPLNRNCVRGFIALLTASMSVTSNTR